MGILYAIYALSFMAGLLMPRWLARKSVVELSHKFTISFSNTAGPVKPIDYQFEGKGKTIKNISSQTYIQTAGELGFALTMISQSGSMNFTLVSDDNVCDMEDNLSLMNMIYDNLETQIAKLNQAQK